MPWAYAVPLGVGLVAVAAVAVILIEVVPVVLEERSRERHRRRRLARQISIQTPPPTYEHVHLTSSAPASSAKTTGVEVPEGGWKYEVRRRRVTGSRKMANEGTGDGETEHYRLGPISDERQHVLGGDTSVAESDLELDTTKINRDERYLLREDIDREEGQGSVPAAPAAAPSDLLSEPGTAPLLSPPLSPSPRDGRQQNETEAGHHASASSAPITADAETSRPVRHWWLEEGEEEEEETEEEKEALARAMFLLDPDSCGPTLSYLKAPSSSEAPADQPSKHDSPASVGDWVLASPAPSVAASLASEDDGWSRLSADEDEWHEVPVSRGLGASGLQLEGVGHLTR